MISSRTQKAFWNTATSLGVQLVGVICGFVVPIAYISAYGSEYYGAIGSITQLLSFIALLEAGVGGVTRAALYKPLAIGDTAAISSIFKATQIFFRKIGSIFFVYSLLIAFFFPVISGFTGDPSISFFLTLAIAAGTLAQYMFGISYSILLQADQRNYIGNVLQMITSCSNAIAIIALVNLGFGIVIVQAASALLFVLRPVALSLYARKRYKIDGGASPDNMAISDRWNGLGHHISFYIRSNISVFAATLLLPISEVAVLTVYNLIANGMQKIVSAFASGLEAGFGDLIARGERESLRRNFRIFETLDSVLIIAFFSTALSMAVPFVQVYTAGVTDVDYVRPVFSFLLISSAAVYCLRLPYNYVTLAAGHYRQTRNGAFLEAGIAVALSFILVAPLGLTGAAIALLVSTSIRTIQYGVYSSSYILRRPKREFAWRLLFTAALLLATTVFGFVASNVIVVDGYLPWCCVALVVFASSLAISLFGVWLVYREDFAGAKRKILSLLKRG